MLERDTDRDEFADEPPDTGTQGYGNPGNEVTGPRRSGVIVIVGGLIYFPMLILGPVGERIVG